MQLEGQAESVVLADLQNHIDDPADAHDASAISVVPVGGLAADDVQEALAELDSEKAAVTRTLTAGSGLSGGGNLSADRTFDVNVDDSTLEINADTLRIKDGGVTAAKVAADVATQAELDAHINDTVDAHDAGAISIADSGGHFAGDDVEEALEELATARGAIVAKINGGGTAITTGLAGFVEVPFACQIVAARIVADQVGSILVDIWKDTYANIPPTNADSICGTNEPELVAAQKAQDTTLSGWTTTLAAGDWLWFNVDSATTVTKVTVSLTIERI